MSRMGDYAELAKPRLVLLAALMAALAFLMASDAPVNRTALLLTFTGSYLVGAAAAAFNQILERRTDALMRRTANRPLPAGRLQIRHAFIFGAALGFAGLVILFSINALTGLLALTTLTSYLGIYTPLKRRTCWNTLVGAVPGALPCLIGWTAARNRLDPEAFTLFLILFVWQLPHFFAIAWVYREEYRAAGLKMLSTQDETGKQTAAQIFIFSCILAATSLLPAQGGWAGSIYWVSALAGGAALVVLAGVLVVTRLRFARGFATVSIFYLVLLMTGLAVERL